MPAAAIAIAAARKQVLDVRREVLGSPRPTADPGPGSNLRPRCPTQRARCFPRLFFPAREAVGEIASPAASLPAVRVPGQRRANAPSNVK